MVDRTCIKSGSFDPFVEISLTDITGLMSKTLILMMNTFDMLNAYAVSKKRTSAIMV